MSDTFDVVVLGAGSTGTATAGALRDRDLTVAVVERELVGGECSYWACMPSKSLLAPVRAIAAARRLPGASTAVSGSVDVDAVFDRRDRIVSHFDDSPQVDWLDSVGATLVRGDGRLVGVREVAVTTDDGIRTLRARQAVAIATGSRPSLPPIAGIDDVNPWTSRDVTTASELPRRLAILGGGVVGCEMAQAYRRLGAEEVTIVEQADRLLDGFDPWVGDMMATKFADEGIVVRTGADVRAVRRADDASVTVTTDGSDVVADELLVATGRTPNTDDIGLEAVGQEPDGFLAVDDLLRVEQVDDGWLYAVGDVNGRALLTHQGKYQGRCVAQTIAGEETPAVADRDAVPQVVFTDPEVATVGKTGVEGDDDPDLEVVTVDLDSAAGATLKGDTGGRASLVLDRRRQVVVGATFVGTDVGELLHAATIAIVGAVAVDQLWHAVPAFPTVSEVWLRLLEARHDA